MWQHSPVGMTSRNVQWQINEIAFHFKPDHVQDPSCDRPGPNDHIRTWPRHSDDVPVYQNERVRSKHLKSIWNLEPRYDLHTGFLLLWPWPWPSDLDIQFYLDILEAYLLSMSKLSKVGALQTDTHRQMSSKTSLHKIHASDSAVLWHCVTNFRWAKPLSTFA